MIIIGVTGGFGTGKSTVSKIFNGLGASVLDADKLAHKAIRPGAAAYKKAVKLFGSSILNKEKKIDRKKLSQLVFSDAKARRALEGIVHPQVIKDIKKSIAKLAKRKSCKAVALDVPLLIEAGMHKLVDVLVVVSASREKVFERLSKKGFSKKEILTRQKAQLGMAAKAALADYVVDNSDGFNKTRMQVRNIWLQVKSRCRRR